MLSEPPCVFQHSAQGSGRTCLSLLTPPASLWLRLTLGYATLGYATLGYARIRYARLVCVYVYKCVCV